MEEQNKNTVQKAGKNKSGLIIKIIAFTLAFILTFVLGYFSKYIFDSSNITTASDVIKLMEKVGYIYDPVTGEKIELTPEQIADAIVSVVLDDYSAYYTPEEYKQVNENSKGNFLGIGVSFYDYDNVIDSVAYNSPSDIAGIKVGDKILSIAFDDSLGGKVYEIIDLYGFSDAMNQALNEQPIQIKVDRSGEMLDFEVQKQAFIAAYIKYMDSEKTLCFRTENNSLVAKTADGGMNELDGDTAYVSFTGFNGGAGAQLASALEFMKERGRTKLILDLRDNGGGYTTVLEEVASLLIYNQGKTKSLIAFSDGKKFDQEFYTKSNGFNTDITAITVLANDNTASASECLIGAMLHYKDRFSESNLIIEKNAQGVARTYGKGIMQTTYGLISGGALKLTTAKIFLPDKTTSIHGKGFIAQGLNAVEKGQAINRAIEILA